MRVDFLFQLANALARLSQPTNTTIQESATERVNELLARFISAMRTRPFASDSII